MERERERVGRDRVAKVAFVQESGEKSARACVYIYICAFPLLPRYIGAVGRGPRESAPGACVAERRQIGRSAPNVGARASLMDEMKLFFIALVVV